MILTLDSLLSAIDRNKYTYAKMWSGYEAVDERPTFEQINATNPEDLKRIISEIAKQTNGHFTLHLCRTKDNIGAYPQAMQVQFSEAKEAQVIQTPIAQTLPEPRESAAEMETRITKTVMDGLVLQRETERKEERFKAQDAKLAELDHWSGKLANVLGKVFEQYAGDLLSPSMQGLPDNVSEEVFNEPQALEKSLGVLVTEFGEEAIIALANNPDSIAMLKMALKPKQ